MIDEARLEGSGCRCHAHSQHTVYRFLFRNPGTSLKAAAGELHMSHLAVRLAKSRLKKRTNLSRLCPECFEPSLQGLTCGNCGVELDEPFALGQTFESQSPVHSIQPLGGLGSVTDYSRLGLQYGGSNVRHLAERPENALLEKCRSMLWQELKGPMFRDGVVEEANQLLTRHVSEFQGRFPTLLRSKGVAAQLVENVTDLLKLRYPNCFAVSAETRVLVSERARRFNSKESRR